MGLNIVVYRRHAGKVVGEATEAQWDSLRHSGDREFAKEVLGDQLATWSEREDGYDGEWYYRPLDIDRWKSWDAAFHCNNGRWSALADLLASDTGFSCFADGCGHHTGC